MYRFQRNHEEKPLDVNSISSKILYKNNDKHAIETDYKAAYLKSSPDLVEAFDKYTYFCLGVFNILHVLFFFLL